MEIQPNIGQVDFEIAISSFRDELISKLDYFNTIEIQLLRKFQCNVNVPQSHSELVFYLRNMIQLLEEAFKDVESYFDDLQMTFLYDYFRKAQILMVNGFNFLSQALVIQIDLNEKDREDKSKSREMERMVMVQQQRTVKGPAKTLKEQAKEIQHYDFAINYYENQEAKIAEELHRIQDNIMMSKGLVDKLHPSKAVKELQEIKQRAEITLENTQKIFEETYQLKYLEFKQYLSKLQRPEDVTRDFCDNLKITMREKFQIGMKKSVNALYCMRKEDEMNKLKDEYAQTDDVEIVALGKVEKKATFTTKNGEKLHNLLVKERKLTEKLLTDLQNAKKEVEILTNEKFRLQVICRALETQNVEYQSNYDILSKIYDEKREEITAIKKTMAESEQVIDKLRSYEMRCLNAYSPLQAETQTQDLRTFESKEIQANMQDNEIIVILKKTNEKMGERIREKQIRIKEIERKQVTDKKEKIGRLRISQVLPTQLISNITLGRQGSNNDFRSSQSSEKSIASVSNKGDKIIQNIPQQKLAHKVSNKSSKFARPSNFSIKRLSNCQKILELKKDYGVQVGQSCEIKFYTCKSIQVESGTTHFQLQLRPNLSSKEEKRTESIANFRPVEILSQRVQQNSRFLKKHLTSSKDRFYRKEISNETVREDSISNVRFEVFADSEEPDHPVKEERDRVCGFERLNIQTQENKIALQKRSALSKQFLYNIKRREKSSQQDEKNKTCIGEFYKSRRENDNFQTKHLICIDRLNYNKKDSKRYEKMSIPSKTSQKLIKEKENIK